MKVLVTGASGFIGQRLVQLMLERKLEINTCSRSTRSLDQVNHFQVGDLNEISNWKDIIQSSDCVIHLAAKVHMMEQSDVTDLNEYRLINRDATLRLASEAANSGVKRFIFLSSVKVNGEMTKTGISFNENDKNIPQDPYGLSKYEAEQGLLDIGQTTGMEVVIIRSPLVYGPCVKGNFRSMVHWVRKAIPIPLGSVMNRRSLIALDNLVDFILLCTNRERTPQAANQVFLISDGEDVSTTELLRKVARAYGVKSRLIPVPVGLMEFLAKVLGMSAIAERLFGNLQVDSAKARDLLGWKPIITMNDQLVKMAEHERGTKNSGFD